MLENLLVGVIVAAVLFLTARSLYRTARGKGSGCGCGKQACRKAEPCRIDAPAGDGAGSEAAAAKKPRAAERPGSRGTVQLKKQIDGT